MNEYSFLPDMSVFPDCEEKRQIENLAQKLELHINKMTSEKDMDDAYDKGHNDGSNLVRNRFSRR